MQGCSVDCGAAVSVLPRLPLLVFTWGEHTGTGFEWTEMCRAALMALPLVFVAYGSACLAGR